MTNGSVGSTGALSASRVVLDERFRGIDHQFALFDAKLDGLRHELVGTMHKEFRGQTWRLITAFFGRWPRSAW